MDARLTALEHLRRSAKIRAEAAIAVHDGHAALEAMDELEQIDLQVKRVLTEIEKEDE